MDKTNVRVDFRIMGEDYHPEVITNVLNIEPVRFWYKGDDIRNTGNKRKYTGWIFSTGYDETLDINTQLSKLIKIFTPKVSLLLDLKKKYNLDYSIDIISIIENGNVPAAYLESKTIQFIANIDAMVDFDTYINE